MLERGNAVAATDSRSKATAANPDEPEAWLTLGAAYDAAGNRAQARGRPIASCVQSGQGAGVSECRALLGE